MLKALFSCLATITPNLILLKKACYLHRNQMLVMAIKISHGDQTLLEILNGLQECKIFFHLTQFIISSNNLSE